MNRFFLRMPLEAKLVLIGLIPFCFLLFLTIQVYNEKTQKLVLLDNYKSYLAESANINGLIDAMQEERKYSFDYAMTKSMRQELLLQRPKTDALIQKLVESGDPSITGFTSYTKVGEIADIRSKIDSAKIGPNEVMHFYSNTVFRLNTLNTIPPANTPYLQPVYKDLMAQKILSEMITYLGIIRSNIYNVLHTRQYMVETLIGTIGTHDVYNSYDAELLAKGTPEILKKYRQIRNTTAMKPTSEYIDSLFKRFTFDESLTAAQWWKISDDGVNELRQFQGSIWKDLNTKIDKMHRDTEESRRQTFIFLILALVCCAAVILYIAYLISMSLRQLRSAARKIAQGETGVQINIESNDAIGNLARSISDIAHNNRELTLAAMAIGKGNFDSPLQPRSTKDELGNAIVQMQQELQQYNRKMEQKVSQRTEELARSNEDLKQFAHVASHDMKEPLRKITMFSRILNDDHKDALSEKGRLYLEKIEKAAIRMSDMIEGILAYSTVSFKEPPFETVNLNTVLEEVKNDLELAIIQKEARIDYSGLPMVNGIPLLLHQLFYNLINNALKFAKPETPPVIKIVSEIAPHRNPETTDGKDELYHHITVSDNGLGFAQEHAEKIFGIFSRLNPKDQFEGTGLGLALCRKIIYRHHGEISAEGKEGSGAIFHIWLPVNILEKKQNI